MAIRTFFSIFTIIYVLGSIIFYVLPLVFWTILWYFGPKFRKQTLKILLKGKNN